MKQALNHGSVLKILHRTVQFKQKAWLKSYINMNTDLKKNEKHDFEKDIFKLMNNAVFVKTIKNVRKHRNIKLVTTESRRNYLMSEANYHTKKNFSENLLSIEMKKTQIYLNKSVYL